MCSRLIGIVVFMVVLVAGVNSQAVLFTDYIGGGHWDGTMAATASGQIHTNYLPELTVNGAGLDVTGLLHRNNFSVNVWEASDGGTVHPGTVTGPAWIAYDFGSVVPLDSMWVWNLGLTGYTGRGLRNVTIEVSTTGGPSAAEWSAAWTGEFNESLGVDNYAHETEVDLGGIDARYVVITSSDVDGSWGLTPRGIAEARFNLVPEPATLLLLALGGAATLRRKVRK